MEVQMGRVCSMTICTESWFQSLKRRDHLEDAGIERSIILKGILKK
jgi:hypothetical protein